MQFLQLASVINRNDGLSRKPFNQGDLVFGKSPHLFAVDPDHTECYRGLAVLLSETGRQDAAFRLLEGWASRSPHLAEPRIELARLLEETNHLPQATGRLVEALTIDPHNSRALTALGRLRELSGQPAQDERTGRIEAIDKIADEIFARTVDRW